MRSPQTIGVECPLPGRVVFQRMFLVSLHSTGGLASGATPVPSGPRHCGQLARTSASPSPAASAAARRQVSSSLATNKCTRISFWLVHVEQVRPERFYGFPSRDGSRLFD